MSATLQQVISQINELCINSELHAAMDPLQLEALLAVPTEEQERALFVEALARGCHYAILQNQKALLPSWLKAYCLQAKPEQELGPMPGSRLLPLAWLAQRPNYAPLLLIYCEAMAELRGNKTWLAEAIKHPDNALWIRNGSDAPDADRLFDWATLTTTYKPNVWLSLTPFDTAVFCRNLQTLKYFLSQLSAEKVTAETYLGKLRDASKTRIQLAFKSLLIYPTHKIMPAEVAEILSLLIQQASPLVPPEIMGFYENNAYYQHTCWYPNRALLSCTNTKATPEALELRDIIHRVSFTYLVRTYDLREHGLEGQERMLNFLWNQVRRARTRDELWRTLSDFIGTGQTKLRETSYRFLLIHAILFGGADYPQAFTLPKECFYPMHVGAQVFYGMRMRMHCQLMWQPPVSPRETLVEHIQDAINFTTDYYCHTHWKDQSLSQEGLRNAEAFWQASMNERQPGVALCGLRDFLKNGRWGSFDNTSYRRYLVEVLVDIIRPWGGPIRSTLGYPEDISDIVLPSRDKRELLIGCLTRYCHEHYPKVKQNGESQAISLALFANSAPASAETERVMPLIKGNW